MMARTIAAVGLALLLTNLATANDSSEVVKITARADKPSAEGKQVITISLDIDNGWHVYANPVGNETLASVQTVVKVTGGKVAKIDYPEGKLIKDDTVGDYREYVGKVDIKVTVERAKDATEPVQLSVKIQACNDKECRLPSTVKLKVD